MSGQSAAGQPSLPGPPLVFRLRYLLHTLIFALGIWAPWNYVLHADPTGVNAHVWGLLSANLAAVHLMRYGAAFQWLLVLATVLAVLAAALRTWAAAYLGSDVVQDSKLRAGVVADGPYRYVRNPLYLGVVLHVLALALVMPRSGALFAIAATVLLDQYLIQGEESFLNRTLGTAYSAYARLVPRLVPALRPRIAGGGQRPRWGQAFLGEIYMWGVVLVFAVLGWQYNAPLLVQGVVVSFGVSLVLQAVRGRSAAAPPA